LTKAFLISIMVLLIPFNEFIDPITGRIT